MAITELITPMNFTLIRDALCQLLANSRDSQKEIAKTNGMDDAEINQNIDFTVFPKRFRYPDISEMPCVFLYFNKMTFPEQDIYENFTTGTLRVEYYAAGKTETYIDDNGDEIIITADENAEDRLNYLTSQIYKTLCCEAVSVYSGTNNMIKEWRLLSWGRIVTPESDNTAGTVLGAAFEFEAGYNEPTYYVETHEIEEFYTTLHINDNYIDPVVRTILNKS